MAPASNQNTISSKHTKPCARLLERMPMNAWDSHIHLVDPARYPLAPDATYSPSAFGAWDNVLFESSIGASYHTIIQPSIYGTDNSAVIDGLKAFGPGRSRAVVVFDPAQGATTPETLAQWHDLGVRGVRVNMGFTQIPTVSEFSETLRLYANAIRPLDWILQVYIPLSMIGELEDLFPTLGVRIVFDHMGHPTVSREDAEKSPYDQDGFKALINLLRGGRAWTKISAPYRLCDSKDGKFQELDPIIRELLQVAPDRIVYASDWPHVLHEGLDIRQWTEHLLDLVGDDESLRNRLFRDNAKELWK